MDIKDDEYAACNSRDGPTEPDGPTKSPKSCSQSGHNDGAGDKETNSRKQIDTCMSRGLATY